MARDTKQHCTWGHEFTEGNSYYDGRGYRSCRQCRKDKVYKDRASNKAPVEYKSKVDIAIEIARADYTMGFYNKNMYVVATFNSVMHALNEIE